MPAGEIQTLDARYVDGAALLGLLTQLFGRGNFTIDVRLVELDFTLSILLTRRWCSILTTPTR